MTVGITRSVIKSRLASLSLVGDEKGQQSVVIAHLALIPPRKMAGGMIFEGAELGVQAGVVIEVTASDAEV